MEMMVATLAESVDEGEIHGLGGHGYGEGERSTLWRAWLRGGERRPKTADCRLKTSFVATLAESVDFEDGGEEIHRLGDDGSRMEGRRGKG